MAKKDKEVEVEPELNEATIIACSSEWGQANWRHGKVELHDKAGQVRTVKLQNLPANTLIVIPMED